MLVLDEKWIKLYKTFRDASQDHSEHVKNLQNFAQGDGAKLSMGLRKFVFQKQSKVRTWISKSAETIFLIFCIFEVLD